MIAVVVAYAALWRGMGVGYCTCIASVTNLHFEIPSIHSSKMMTDRKKVLLLTATVYCIYSYYSLARPNGTREVEDDNRAGMDGTQAKGEHPAETFGEGHARQNGHIS